jgi:hypothetical protein
MELYHFDVCTDFLNDDLEEEVYMCQPEGLTVKGKEDKVFLLHKAIYGLKQSSRTWNVKVTNVLTKTGYKISVNEPCIFYKITSSKVTIVAVYVDDFLVVSNDSEEKESLKGELEARFKIKDLGKVKQILGTGIHRDKDMGTICINQKKYIKSVIAKFGMTDEKQALSPMEANF